MSIETSLRDALVANAAVLALISTRIYPQMRAENSPLPAIVYRTVSEDPQRSLRSTAALSRSTIEYECIATTVAGAKALAEAVRQAIADTTGTLGDVSHVAVQHSRSSDLFYDPYDGSSAGTYSVLVEFDVMHRTPTLV